MTALLNIGRQEGIKGYFRGLSAFMPRVVAYGAVQLSAYDWAKRVICESLPNLEGMALQAPAGFVAAVLAVTAIQPFDFVSHVVPRCALLLSKLLPLLVASVQIYLPSCISLNVIANWPIRTHAC